MPGLLALRPRPTVLKTGKLSGKRAIITGAAHGIGQAIARRFALEGATLLLADIDADGLACTANELDQLCKVTDMGEKSQVDALFDLVERDWRALDILVNNAGVTHAAGLADVTEAAVDRLFAVNLKSALFATQRAARLMRPGASIINISCANAVLAIEDQIPYAVTKGAVRLLTNATATSLAPRGIRVNAIGPGTMTISARAPVAGSSDFNGAGPAETLVGKIGTVDEIAGIALFLAGSDSAHMSGQTLYADGGRLGTSLATRMSSPTPA